MSKKEKATAKMRQINNESKLSNKEFEERHKKDYYLFISKLIQKQAREEFSANDKAKPKIYVKK